MNKYSLPGKLFFSVWILAVVLFYLKSFPFITDFFSFGWLIINGQAISKIIFGLLFLGIFNLITSGWGSFWRSLFLTDKKEKSLWLIDIAVGIIFFSVLTYLFILAGWSVKFLAGFFLITGVLLFIRNQVFVQVIDFFRSNQPSLAYIFYLPFLLAPFLIALAPATNYDSLVYHLALPEKYLAAGKIVAVPENIFATFPQNAENLFLLALATGPERLANLLHFNFLLLSVGVLWLIANYYSLNNFFTGLFFLSTPAFLLIAGHSFIDLAVTFYVLLSFYCLERWTVSDKFWIYPLSIFLAFIPTLKYSGFIFWLGLLIVFVVKIVRSDGQKYLGRYLGLFFFTTLVLLSPYLIRNFIFYHNPLAPFLSSVFPTTIPEVVIKNYLGHVQGHGTRIKTILDVLRLPYEITFQGQKFGGAYDILGPIYLAILPGLFFLRKDDFIRFKNLLLFGLLGLAGWLVTARVLRFLLPVVALWPVAVVAVTNSVLADKRRFFSALISIILLHNLLLVFWITGFINPGKFISGQLNREQYLTEKINNSYYPAAAWARKNIRHGKILLWGDARSFYWHRPGLTIIAPTVFDYPALTEQLNKCNNIKNRVQSLADYVYLNYPEGKRLGVEMNWVTIARNKKLLTTIYQDENSEIVQISKNEND